MRSTFPREQLKRARFYLGGPQPHLSAHLAVALEGARAQIDIGFKANGTAVAASCVGLLQPWISNPPRSSGHLFCVLVPFPKGERVVLRLTTRVGLPQDGAY